MVAFTACAAAVSAASRFCSAVTASFCRPRAWSLSICLSFTAASGLARLASTEPGSLLVPSADDTMEPMAAPAGPPCPRRSRYLSSSCGYPQRVLGRDPALQPVVVAVQAAIDAAGDRLEVAGIGQRVKPVLRPPPGGDDGREFRLG